MKLFKKIIALTAAVLICSTSAVAVSAQDSQSEKQALFEYYMKTGEVPPAYSDITYNNNSRMIIGAENRVQVTDTSVFPYKIIGKLYTVESMSTCSAFASNAVLTAAHCVYDAETETMKTFQRIELGMNDDYVFRTITATPAEIIVNPDYIDNPTTRNDWAIILFDSAVVGGSYFGYKKDLAVNDTVILTGYPRAGSVNGNTNTTQWTCTGQITAINGTLIDYNMDMNSGQSGSPIYTSGNYIKGICAAENTTLVTNRGCIISDELYELMASIRSGVYEIGSYQ